MTVATDVRANRRFVKDFLDLPRPVADRVLEVIDLVSHNGPRYPSLHTRTIKKNPNRTFKLMDVDDKYRIVAAVEGVTVFLEKVGNHDETERWGEHATLQEYADLITNSQDAATLRDLMRRKADAAARPTLIEVGPSLPEIAVDDAVAPVLMGDVLSVLKGYQDGLLEDWMVFLSPLQRRTVDRAVNGPARITGGPGTGKTVVALHRAKALAAAAQDGSGSILMTSFVGTVPDVLEGLFERFAGELASRVRFLSLHQLADQVLVERGIRVKRDPAAAGSRLERSLVSDPERAARLRRAGCDAFYLTAEITRVIAGRDVSTLEDYLKLARHGRRRPLDAAARGDVWAIAQEYRRLCDAHVPPLVDIEESLRRAYHALRDAPHAHKYRAIVVDEAQDLTEVGLRFLLELLADGPKGQILLAGDGGQRIYAGGYRLADLGVEVRGRSFVLSECYRSTDEIMRAVGALGRYLSTEDFGEDGVASTSTQTLRTGPQPRLHGFPTGEAERAWVTATLGEPTLDRDSCAVLLPTTALMKEWLAALRAAGLPVCDLKNYTGRPTSGVKVGNYHRAKGLEFKRVFLPALNLRFPPADRGNIDHLIGHGSQLYVAMSRARDELDLSYAGGRSVLLQPVLQHVSQVEHAAG